MTEKRLQRLREELAGRNLEAVLLTNSYNRRYMTGFTGSAGFVLITADRQVLITDFRYVTQASRQAVGYEIVEHGPKPIVTVRELLEKLKVNRLGFEQDDVTYGTYRSFAEELGSIELTPTSSLVERLRMFKEPAEIAVMQEAADLADRTFSHILSYLKPGVTEREIALEMEVFIRKNGATSSSFETIVASGERSALPHGVASDRKLGNNEFVKLDFGALYNGYCSDITRTVGLGQLTEKHKEIYAIVLEAQLNVLDKLKPGMTGKEGDALARDIIKKAGYGDAFGHGTGHSLGLEIHENPRLSPLCDTVLEPGMTMTVEPGIYIPGFGGVRIEDDVVITENGVQILTHSNKQLFMI